VENPNGLHLTEFWNRSIRTVANVDGIPYPGPGPVFATMPQPRDGALLPDPGDSYAVAEAGVTPVGTVVEQREQWTLVRLDRPLRLASVQNGIDPDNWMGADSSYAQYSSSPRAPGTVSVVASRAGWHGPDVGGRVVVRLSPGGRTFSRPIHSGETAAFSIRAPRPPFRVSVHVTRTFVPAHLDPNETDTRVLGAQVSFGFTPSR
jgi:hypothetical protein